jgi:preprotein translocase subunit SecG
MTAWIKIGGLATVIGTVEWNEGLTITTGILAFARFVLAFFSWQSNRKAERELQAVETQAAASQKQATVSQMQADEIAADRELRWRHTWLWSGLLCQRATPT